MPMTSGRRAPEPAQPRYEPQYEPRYESRYEPRDHQYKKKKRGSFFEELLD